MRCNIRFLFFIVSILFYGVSGYRYRNRGNVEFEKCLPCSLYKEDCNTCMCNREGTGGSCTKMWCHELIRNYPLCRPSDVFPLDIYSCVCGPDGMYAACDFPCT